MGDLPLALITGGVHRLGRVFAHAMARQGHAILIHYYQSSSDQVVQIENEIRTMGMPVYSIAADLQAHTSIEQIGESIDRTGFPLRVVINSAAIMPRQSVGDIHCEDWDAVLNLNLRAPFLLTQMAATRIKDGGLIINISDAGIYKLWKQYPTYIISKAALDMMTKYLARNLAPRIRVNSIAPGLVMPPDDILENEWNNLVERLPLKRRTSIADLESALLFLLKNESITGQNIIVDGGYSIA